MGLPGTTVPQTLGPGVRPQPDGSRPTHRVSPRSEGDGLHVVVGNDLQGTGGGGCGSSAPSLGWHLLPATFPLGLGLTGSGGPGYEPQGTRGRPRHPRSHQQPGEGQKPGSRLAADPGAPFRSLPPATAEPGPSDQEEVGAQQAPHPPRCPRGAWGHPLPPSRARRGHDDPRPFKASRPAPASHLLAVGGHEVEAAGGDGQGDGHAGELQVAFPQDGVQGAAAGLGAGGSVGKGAPEPGTSSPSRGSQLSSPSPRGRREPRVAGLRSSPRPRAARARWQPSRPSLTFLLRMAPLAPGTASHTRPIASLRGAQQDVSLGWGPPLWSPHPPQHRDEAAAGRFRAHRHVRRALLGGGRGNQRRRDGVKARDTKGKPSGWLRTRLGQGKSSKSSVNI